MDVDQTAPVLLSLPFHGRWLAINSPARRVPSHGTDLAGQRYAIDLIGVDSRRRTALRVDARALFGTEPPDRFVGFGRPVLAPADGTVVTVHDGEPDHSARRSPVTLLPYLLSQRSRLRRGFAGLAGNHIVIAIPDGFVALVHLRNGSTRVRVGDAVGVGLPIAECGNSGNSTQPHLHVQVMDSADPMSAAGRPMQFRDYRQWLRRGAPARVDVGIPAEGAVVEPLEPAGPGP